MFYYLNGTITILDTNLAVVDCGGVGYACHTTNYTISRLQVGRQARLYTYCNIKEDAFDIFGFYTREELDCFEKLLSVGGVGTEGGAGNPVGRDAGPVYAGGHDTGREDTYDGAGRRQKKLAERIMLELKGKFTPAQMEANVAQMDLASPVRGSKTAEATAALSSLGYSQQEIAAALKGVDVNAMTVEDMVRHALRAMVMQ